MKPQGSSWGRWALGVVAAIAVVMLRPLIRPIARWLRARMSILRVKRSGLSLLAFVTVTLGLGATLLLIDGSARIGHYQGPLTEGLSRMISPRPPTVANVRAELDCLAHNVYFEARGEPDQGMAAVAHVVMNRAASGRYPGTVCEVVRQGGGQKLHKCQFSWWCDGQSDRPTEKTAWSKSQDVARQVYWGSSEDPTRGALWYHAAKVKPIWRKALVRGPQIGDHIFYLSPASAPQLASRAGEAAD